MAIGNILRNFGNWVRNSESVANTKYGAMTGILAGVGAACLVGALTNVIFPYGVDQLVGALTCLSLGILAGLLISFVTGNVLRRRFSNNNFERALSGAVIGALLGLIVPLLLMAIVVVISGIFPTLIVFPKFFTPIALGFCVMSSIISTFVGAYVESRRGPAGGAALAIVPLPPLPLGDYQGLPQSPSNSPDNSPRNAIDGTPTSSPTSATSTRFFSPASNDDEGRRQNNNDNDKLENTNEITTLTGDDRVLD